jgi:predicted permease
MGIFQWNSRTISGENQAERVAGAAVDADLFPVLGVAPILGRTITAREVQEAQRVVVIGNGLWRRRFGGESSVLGKRMTIDGEPYTIVGVMPPRFQFPYSGEVWTPLVHEPGFERRGSRYLAGALGRLAAGVTRAEAETELARVSAQLSQTYQDTNNGWAGLYVPLREDLFGPLRQGVIVLFIAAGFVLLIVCGNLANLLLARGAARHREIALRAAIGAGRGRLVRQFLTESLVLAALGGSLAVAVAVWGVRILRVSATDQLPAFIDITAEPKVFAFEFGVALVVALVTGLLPALRGTQLKAQAALKEGMRATTSVTSSRVRSALIVSEVVLAVVLLAGSLLLFKTMRALNEVNLGFDPENVLTARYALPSGKYDTPEKRALFLDAIQQRLRSEPGVISVGAAQGTPFSGWNVGNSYHVQGEAPPTPGHEPSTHVQVVTPDYFRTMGIPLVKGRMLEPGDATRSNLVVVVNQSFVARHFAGQDPIGKHMRMGDQDPWATIVGVIGDFRHFGITEEPQPSVYWHFAAASPTQITLAIRTRGNAADLIPVLRRDLAALDPDVPAFREGTMEETIARLTWVQRILRNILIAFALTAAALAVIGLYGVISYSVTQQRHEFGIRLALGAAPGQLLRQVVRVGVMIASVGIAIGWVVAFLAARGLQQLLYQVNPRDVATFVIVPVVVAAMALLAAAGPALRAASTDPMLALRNE